MPEHAKDSARAGRGWHRRIASNVWYFFNSLKLTIFVLITLAAVSIFGTFIEQNLPVERYLASYGEKWTRVLLYTGANDLFHTWWFLSLLTVLALNIIVCTFERFPPKWKSLLNHRPKGFDASIIERFSHNCRFTLDSDAGAVKESLLGALKRKRFKVETFEVDGGWNMYAWKGVVGRYGSDFTHISLLLILLGAIVGSVMGFKDFRVIYVGDTIKIPNETFELRLDKFWIDYYDSGQIRQYNSQLAVMEDGKEVLSKQIWVNEPLYYKGVRFYQSSYGMAWNKVAAAYVALARKEGEKLDTPVKVPWNEKVRMPGSPYSVKVVQYAADFAYDDASNVVYSLSAEAKNPAVKLEVYRAGKVVSTPWIFLKYPGIFPAIPNSKYDLVLTNYQPVLYSGLSVNKDPGTNIVWAGTIVMGIGFYLAFFVYFRRLWISVRQSGNSVEVGMGGMINKNNLVLEKEMEFIRNSVSSGGEGAA